MNISLRAQRVYAGIAVMDEKHGEDWVFKVDPGSLEMDEPCLCVVGQVYGGAEWWDLDDADPWRPSPFEAGVFAMGLDSLQQSRCGFYTAESIDRSGLVEADYWALTRIWAYAIGRLRELRGGAE